MQFGPLMATSVGSLPRPSWLAATERSRATFRLEGEALREAQDDATLLALREQEGIGLDILTDGEQRRESFVYHAAATWDGIDMTDQREKETYRNRRSPRIVPRVTGTVKRRAPACLEEVRFAKSHTRRPVKVAVAGPMTVIDSTLDEFYGDEAALAMDIAAAVNAELLDLQAAGCDVLQLDEPAMTRYHDKVFAYGARALVRCLEGVRVPTFVHLCFGYRAAWRCSISSPIRSCSMRCCKPASAASPWSSRAATLIPLSSRSAVTGSSCSDASIRATRPPRRWARSSSACARRSVISIRSACCWRPIAD
jgi:5-methyltetrahydropteroyltriglutamate--homocysteine methyltransferase